MTEQEIKTQPTKQKAVLTLLGHISACDTLEDTE